MLENTQSAADLTGLPLHDLPSTADITITLWKPPVMTPPLRVDAPMMRLLTAPFDAKLYVTI
ncbi:hypothetical protein ACFWR9_35470 [Streptomyces sp. NPDC058534]|uniref:hypothetical protein n=1 Tax=Streptomyces sp. NPDC058534 TaxID=3346541 RepID=UPI0036690F30